MHGFYNESVHAGCWWVCSVLHILAFRYLQYLFTYYTENSVRKCHQMTKNAPECGDKTLQFSNCKYSRVKTLLFSYCKYSTWSVSAFWCIFCYLVTFSDRGIHKYFTKCTKKTKQYWNPYPKQNHHCTKANRNKT